ncbi:MAG: hypothetical protein QOJ53_309 [Sphingomonadales bacterium]|jgi:GNAT superfamily N-acetyltransferase|nr:hypothetical protein [Sphingomonadales bacterium]MEA3045977.1 hypothetical protein [Sphingomonadales bacterium]
MSREDMDVDAAKAIFDDHNDVFGWQPRGAFARSHANGQLIICAAGCEVLGFCRFYDRRDGIRKIYDMAVARAHLRKGIGARMLAAAGAAAPRDRLAIELKCPEGAAANFFYEAMGFVSLAAEAGKRKRLSVWRRDLRG